MKRAKQDAQPLRRGSGDSMYTRKAHATREDGRAWVPLDDEHTMFCFLWWKRGTSAMTLPQPAFKDGTPIRGTGRGNKFLPNTTDWLGRWRPRQHQQRLGKEPRRAAQPKRENVTFYPTASAAQEAGFRPCLRCRPESSPDLAHPSLQRDIPHAVSAIA